jgi:predicted ATPase
MIFLSYIERKQQQWGSDGFPFNIPAIRDLDKIEFTAPVTFFVGENGCGKSTLLESIALGMQAVAIGAHDIQQDPSLEHVRPLADRLTFARRQHPRQGFFFRVEDFFGFTRRVGDMIAELQKLGGEGRRQAAVMAARYGTNPDGRSHGENLLHVLKSRLVPKGLYLLDEPETPLSPLRQIALLSLLNNMVDLECQFIIATHSPILLALPGATILNLQTLSRVSWDDVEHVRLTRAFLNDPQAFLRRL